MAPSGVNAPPPPFYRDRDSMTRSDPGSTKPSPSSLITDGGERVPHVRMVRSGPCARAVPPPAAAARQLSKATSVRRRATDQGRAFHL
ncbi:hypothetical protein LY76DRAFT_595287 [Colletotrichum caudatum]|nr:hypothetical protein LY76DRAFT_595287 [Colletotrichum caudatum]